MEEDSTLSSQNSWEKEKQREGKEDEEREWAKNETRIGDHSIYRKLEIPLFSGDDPLGWIFRVERYFKVNKVAEEEKLDAAVLCFERQALNWVQWKEVRALMDSWEALKRDLVLRFHPSQCGSSYEMIMALRQDKEVADYIERFELLSATLVSCD